MKGMILLAAVVAGALVLAAIGYGVYTLTDAPERAQEWWDEKKLDNFETLANRELATYEDKIRGYEKTLTDLKTKHIEFAGHPEYTRNTERQTHGYRTALGYEIEIAFLTARGQSLAASYREAMSAEGAAISADTGQLEGSTKLNANILSRNDAVLAQVISDGGDVSTVQFPTQTREMTADDLRGLLFEIEDRLTEYEHDRARIASLANEYEAAIAEWEEVIRTSREQLQEMRREVGRINAEIQLQKAREDLDELNRSIRGDSDSSQLGVMIRKFEERQSSFERGQLVRADEKAAATPARLTLDDLDAPSQPAAGQRTSRFLD